MVMSFYLDILKLFIKFYEFIVKQYNKALWFVKKKM